MYLLDLNTIISILQTHTQTGLLRAELPAGSIEQTESCSATITVVRGVIVSCAVLDEDGSACVLGDHAYQILAHVGSLRWTLTLQLSSSLLSPPPSLKANRREHVVPRRLLEPHGEQRNAWTRPQRLVFALIDGKKSAAQIARLLSLSPALVQQALHDLYQMKLLALDHPRETGPVSNSPTAIVSSSTKYLSEKGLKR